jgi:predicted esterase YcpF (UPF0227 family)
MNNKINVLVIHGFNSGPGSKSETLKNHFPYANVYTPQLNNKPIDDINILQEFLDKNTNVHVVGTSLGGFYGLYLALTNQGRDDISFYVINPSYTPYNNFKSKINQSFRNHKNDLISIVDEKFINELKEFQNKVHYEFKILPNVYFYFGDKDDVINHDILKSEIFKFKAPHNIFESNQDHRHEDISKIIKQIKENTVL